MGLGTVREALKVAAAAVSAGGFAFAVNRAKLGYTQYDPSTSILATMLSSGPYLIVCEGEKLGEINGEDNNPSPKRYRVQSNLWLGFVRETDNDFKSIEAFVEAICAAWRASTSMNVVDTFFARPEIDIKRAPAVAKYELFAELVSC